ncbi:uncharacterized protein [Typha latifolia]|uniref:uncharacterized protein isoform X1 n=1 Tax=Typha latifolia TaxID=4733 RepID=UPI003C2BE6F2
MRRRSTTQALLLLPLFFFFFFYGFSETGDSVAPMEKKEQDALYSVIESFVGKWWNGSGLYPDPCGWTPIQGVSCDLFDGFWHITVLNIGPVFENSLECAQDAKFTPELFELKHLKSLSFYNCFSAHQPTTIPSSNWGKISQSLETLEFRSNAGLTGSIPANLGQLTNLQSLVLVENALTGELPRKLGDLVHLRKLVLSGNQFTGLLPTSLGNDLNELLILDMSRNSLTGSLPSSLGGLTSLLKLDLSNNLLHGSLPDELGMLKNLTLLDLRNNNFSGGLAHSLHTMVSLQDMMLSNNPLGGDLNGFGWENLVNLTTLDLSNMGLIGTIPESITTLMSLRFLALDNNHLSGSVPPKLAALPSLTALYLNGNNLTGKLEFPEGFYERMGRRFASWNNPNLCYNAVAVTARHVPVGVQQCKDEQQQASVENSDLRNKVDNSKPDESSSLLASFSLSASKVDGFWWLIFAQETVAAFLLVMLL